MQYLILIYADERVYQTMTQEETLAMLAGYTRFSDDLRSKGAHLGGNRLTYVGNASTVRVRGGRAQVTDGPFAETKEQLGGYFLVEAEGLDAALEWARQVPCAVRGSIEVRPVWSMPAGPA